MNAEREIELLRQQVKELRRLVEQLLMPKSDARLIMPLIGVAKFTLAGGWSSHISTGATIDYLDGSGVSVTADVYDPLDIFSTLGSGDTGYCILAGGNWVAIQAPCPA